MGSYKVKRIISTNVIELELPSTIKIHPVVSISRVHMYRDQVESQRKEQPLCYESPKKEQVSHAFKHLVTNIKSYNADKI